MFETKESRRWIWRGTLACLLWFCLAGIRHGVGSIPSRWVDGLGDRAVAEGLLERLFAC